MISFLIPSYNGILGMRDQWSLYIEQVTTVKEKDINQRQTMCFFV